MSPHAKASSYNFFRDVHFGCPYFDFRCAVETQTTGKCMKKFKLYLDTFVYGSMPQILTFSSSLVTLNFSFHRFFLKLECY